MLPSSGRESIRYNCFFLKNSTLDEQQGGGKGLAYEWTKILTKTNKRLKNLSQDLSDTMCFLSFFFFF